MKNKEVLYLGVRYFILIIIGAALGLGLFYKIFTPLTVHPVSWILDFIYGNSFVESNKIFFNGIEADIIEACVAGSAYYLLFILNLTTPMAFSKRIKSLIFLFFIFLAINLTRIIILAMLYSGGYSYFDLAHKFFWYIGSTLMLVFVWFLNVKIFDIREIPVYTDFKMLLGFINS